MPIARRAGWLRVDTPRLLVGIGLLALLVAAPAFLDARYVGLLTEVLIYGVFALGINVLLGFTGLISLGHAMFLGVGGYGVAILCVLLGWPLWAAVPATVAAAAVFATVVGIICIRVSGVSFLILTLALAQLVHAFAFKTKSIGGDDGMWGVPRPDLSVLGVSSYDASIIFYFMMVFFVVTFAATALFLRSPIGSVLVVIREDETRVRALGYSVRLYKLIAFAVSGVVSSVAGIMHAIYFNFVSPDNLTWMTSGEGLLMVIVGGAQSVLGPVIGAAAFVLLRAGFADVSHHWTILLGLFFMFSVVLLRGGLVGFPAFVRNWRRQKS